MIWLLLIALALGIYAFFIEPRWLKVARYEEGLVSNPTTKFRVVFLSDFHAGGRISAGWWERVTLEANALAPDVVLLGGDFVATYVKDVRSLKPLQGLNAPQGVYFVLGNHDFQDRPQDVRSFLVDLGFIDLTNRTIQLKREGRELEVQGLDEHWYGAPRPIARTSPSIPHLTLAHQPDVAMDLEEGKTDVVLSGHTHGGQVCLPLIGAPWIPTKLKQRVIAGRRLFQGIPVIVSRGLGQELLFPRFGARPEIVVVDVSF